MDPQSGFWRAPSFVIGENCALIFSNTRTNLKLLQLWPLIFCQGRSFKKISATPFKKREKSLEALLHKKSETSSRASYESRQYYQRLWLEMGLVVGLSLSNGTSLYVLWRRAMNMIVVIKLSTKRNWKYTQHTSNTAKNCNLKFLKSFQSESSWGTPDTAFA